MADPPDSSAFEREAADTCRAYRAAARDGPSFEEKRRNLARYATEFYEHRLRIRGNPESRAVLDNLADLDTVVIEMAHDGQLPHLGIVRLVLKAHDIARRDRRAATLYLVGNHYTAAMRPENLRFGAPLKGESPDDVKHPPRIRIGRLHAHTPFRWLPPPSETDLEELRGRIADFVANNIAHEKKRHTRLVRDATERITTRLNDLFALLILDAREVESLGDWLIRVQHDLFHRMLGAEADRIVFLPMADVTHLVLGDLKEVSHLADPIRAIKVAVSEEQLARGEPRYARSPEASVFWVHCPACFRRTRRAWDPGVPLAFVCPYCGRAQVLEGDDAWRWIMPDIVAYEVALFRLGIDGWVVGSHAPYHPVIERAYARVFRSDMPPKFFLTSVPTFRGLGDPADGYRRTRLLRAFLEMEPIALANGLRTPWDENPKLRSDLLAST